MINAVEDVPYTSSAPRLTGSSRQALFYDHYTTIIL